MSEGTPVVPLLKTVFESILEVFILCVAGYILARRGILDRPTQKKLNRLNVSLFTPSLLFSKVAFFLSPAKLRELWIIPIFFVVTTVVSMVVAFVLGWLFRLKRSQRSFAIASSMFMNSNSLPIALMQSLVVTVPGLKWGKDDNKNAMVGRALTYLVLYSTLGMVVRWSYGVRLLSQADPETAPQAPSPEPQSPLLDREEAGFPPSAEEQEILRHHHLKASSDDDDLPSITVHDASRSSSEYLDPGKVFYSFPNSPYPSTQRLPEPEPSTLDHGSDDDDDLLEIPARRQLVQPTSSIWQSRRRRTRRWFQKKFKTFKEFMTAPLWAALLSLVVACIQPLQHMLEVHIKPVKGALTQAGNVSIPLTLVVLGAYFYSPPDPDAGKSTPAEDRRRESMSTTLSQLSLGESIRDMLRMKRRNRSVASRKAEQEKRPGETKTVFVAVVSRMVVTPLLLLPLMALATKFDFQEVFDDPVFVVSNVLLFASPPALTLAQITQAASGDAFERLISRTIFWSYCVVTPPSTIIFVVIGLVLSKL
ncbi:membrane transport protein-domain-containing protein [Cristinia sonorae]|uniref:Membrane transport protein-domain-containing protein n=1 Tax=Cristinia sonorae TaxID=1940300 RepID=A0A8K0XL66_9AGAR|nr:membrane transport protein-domain-containing protein [Cristinia sonorae]